MMFGHVLEQINVESLKVFGCVLYQRVTNELLAECLQPGPPAHLFLDVFLGNKGNERRLWRDGSFRSNGNSMHSF